MYLKRVFIFIFIFVLTVNFSLLYAQTADESWKLYDDTKLGRIDVTVAPEALSYMYNHIYSDSEHVATVRFRNKYIDQTIDSVGFRLRGNTSREAKKKSFKISFNSFIKGRDFFGVEKLNLNGEHNDPSIIRSKLCFDLFGKSGVVASRAAHMQVFINGKNFGLYISVEHIDEEFIKKNFADDSGNLWKCLYPADLKFIGNDPNLYKNLNNNGTPVYELSTNEEIGDFSRLVNLIKIINQTPTAAFEDSLESVMDVSTVLKYFAWNILFGSWDSYWNLSNNYYLYNNPTTKKFSLIPYDYDNSFGVDWSDNDWSAVNPYSPPIVSGGNKPLAEKIMQNNQYKNLYTHFLQFYSNNVFKLNLWQPHLDSLKEMITYAAIADSFRTLDYGFSMNDFNNSYSLTGYSKYHVKNSIKEYVNLRNSNLINQLNYVSAKPIAYKIDYFPKNPKGTDSIYIYVSAFSYTGFNTTSVKLKLSGTANETIYPLNYSPVSNTKIVEEYDRYVCIIPPLGDGKTAEFYVNLINTAGQSQNYPRTGKIIIKTQTGNSNSVVVNEFLADNVNSLTDPNGEHDDWVELYNKGAEPVLLSGKYLTDNPTKLNKWMFPIADSIIINPDEFLLVWLDDQTTQSGLHASFKLSKSGEYIAIVENDGVSIIDSLSFGPQLTDVSFGRYTDGADNWVFMLPTPGQNNVFTDVKDDIIPIEYNIAAYPNPFNPTTTISYSLPYANNTVIKIYDILGREIATLVNEYKTAGSYSISFNASMLSSGIYLCRIESGKFVSTKKIIMVK